MSIPGTIKMMADQYIQLGEDPPGTRLELVDGRIAVCRGKTLQHARADMHLCHQIHNHIIKHKLGMLLGGVDVILGKYDVRRPDISFYAKSRVHLVELDDALRYVPDLGVEVTSEHTEETDRVMKFEQYAKAGMPFYWIVDSERESIDGFQLVKTHYELTGTARKSEKIALPPFEDLTINLADVWWPR